MKLRKEICKKCCNEMVKDSNGRWGADDEMKWQEGYIHCPYHSDYPISSVPEHCYFSLEYLMLEGQEK